MKTILEKCQTKIFLQQEQERGPLLCDVLFRRILELPRTTDVLSETITCVGLGENGISTYKDEKILMKSRSKSISITSSYNC